MIAKVNSQKQLRESIALLETKKAALAGEVKEDFHKLNNLLSETKTKMIDTAIGITSGIIAKKIVVSFTRNPLGNILGNLIEIAIANFVSKHPTAIKYFGGKIIKNIFNRKKIANEKQ